MTSADLRTSITTATGETPETVSYNEGTYYRALPVPSTEGNDSNLIIIIVDSWIIHRLKASP